MIQKVWNKSRATVMAPFWLIGGPSLQSSRILYVFSGVWYLLMV
jgi:hypothetical protein